MGHSKPTVRHGVRLAVMAVLCLGCLISFTSSSRAEAPAAPARPTIAFSPLTSHMQPGEACTLRVVVDDAVDSLSCMEISVSWDTSFASCTAALEGALYRQAGFPTFFRWEHLAPDTVNAADCVLGYRSFIVAPGALVSFVFAAKKNGICHVRFRKTRLFDIDRVELAPVQGARAEIVIGPTTGDLPPVNDKGALFNYPNPFNPATVIVLAARGSPRAEAWARVSVEVYASSGARVRSLYRGPMGAERLELPWDGRDDRGLGVAAGVYFAVATTGSGVMSRKMILVR
jgi:hypothetical protein